MVRMGDKGYFIGPDSRECGTCRAVKSYADFTPRGTVDGVKVYKSKCKACCATAMRKWAKDNPERHSKTRHEREMRETYGIDPSRYWRMLKEQDGKCAICRQEQSARHASGTIYRLSVDHCHDTGRVRGLLCNNCNRAIGLLKDRVDLLKSAIDYLKGSGQD
jgi:hypothetical protein